MHENLPVSSPRALLVGLDTGEYDAERSLEELSELAKSAGAEVAGVLLQKRPAPDPATCIGSGRLAELAELCKNGGAELVIFDLELSGSQLRAIEKVCDCRVIDRTMLILDIFAQRAVSAEGRLQVELAQQRYRLPRLIGAGQALSRLGGGIGTRGPGETKLESDRRHVRRRIAALESELDALSERRDRLRERRRRDGRLTVALVGYTNVGKSTLLNTLTNAGVLAEDKLFATLDPTARALTLPDGRQVTLVDTVGFLSRLPHPLVRAFASTLDEAASADLIVCLYDASNPAMAQQRQVTLDTLSSLGAGDIPLVTALNKCDLLALRPELLPVDSVLLSAKTGEGVPALLALIAERLRPLERRLRVLLPYSEGALAEQARREGHVLAQSFIPEGILLELEAGGALLAHLLPFESEKPE